jgi:hypothetical protein
MREKDQAFLDLYAAHLEITATSAFITHMVMTHRARGSLRLTCALYVQDATRSNETVSALAALLLLCPSNDWS